MIIVVAGIIVALLLFPYFQRKHSERNMQRFERSRDKYEELLERLRNAEGKNKNTENEN